MIILFSLCSGCIGGGNDNGNETQTPTTKPPTTTPFPNENYNWDLYEFNVGDSFTYEVGWEASELILAGEFTMEFQACATHDYQVHYYGSYDGNMNGSFNSTFKTNKEDFYQNFMQSMISSNPTVSPLFMFTIIAPWWGPYFSNNEIYIGNSWSFSMEGNTSTFSFDSACSHAGVNGYLGLWTFSGQGYTTTLKACISPSFPLATYTEYMAQQDSNTTIYRSELVDWSL